MDQTKANKYLEKSGLLQELNEENVKKFFIKLFKQFESGKLSGNDFSEIIDRLFYKHIYDADFEIQDSGLLTAMQMITELKEVTEDEYNLILDPVRSYIEDVSNNS